MKIIVGIAFTLVVLIFCIHFILEGIKKRKLIPFLIVFGLVIVYFLCYYSELAFNLTWNILLIPQIMFLLYVFLFMIVSLTRRNSRKQLGPNVVYDNSEFISVVVAVHNEENVVEDTVKNLLNLDYPKEKYDITFIDDFSTDQTVSILKKFKNEINIIDRSEVDKFKVFRGKPAAINENINKLKGDLICILDADSIIEKEFLKKLAPKFMDSKVGIVQARNIFYNRNRNLMTILTSIDIYSMQHTIYIPLSTLGFGMFEGRAGIFRKKIFTEINGYDTSLPGEDFDFAYRVGLKGYNVIYEDKVYSNEQVTETPLEWFMQRKRWLGNHVLSCFKNLDSLYKNVELSISRKIAASFFVLNLFYAFTFNFFGPLILINESKYFSIYSYIFIASFSLTVIFFCLSYILRFKKIWLIPLLPVMIIYYWCFTIIQTWVLINEKILKVKLSYKKAFHRKPLLNEI